jgi:16S rRNA (cytosine967-C5)-methyltransferase
MAQIQARDAAFLALDIYFRMGVFIADSLERFKEELSEKDYNLAYEIAAGVVRRKDALDALAKKYAALPKKRSEKIMLRMCLYQLLFLDRIPNFAVGDEMVALAKKRVSPQFAKFLNAFIRNQASKCSLDDLSEVVRLSYPDYFVDRLASFYTRDKALELLELGNKKVPLFARDRKNMKMVALDGKSLDSYIKNPEYYIQNPAQFEIYAHLKNALTNAPKTILDLAASPGGKTVLMHDFFPDAEFFANDISEKKLETLKENFAKYSIQASLTVGSGTEFTSSTKFDLIIVDAPCSNSGCLYKCPEARWRLNFDEIAKHALLQRKLVQHALTLLKPDGVIFYSTCSILPEENEHLVGALTEVAVKAQIRVLPSADGHEGGFGALLCRR